MRIRVLMFCNTFAEFHFYGLTRFCLCRVLNSEVTKQLLHFYFSISVLFNFANTSNSIFWVNLCDTHLIERFFHCWEYFFICFLAIALSNLFVSYLFNDYQAICCQPQIKMYIFMIIIQLFLPHIHLSIPALWSWYTAYVDYQVIFVEWGCSPNLFLFWNVNFY